MSVSTSASDSLFLSLSLPFLSFSVSQTLTLLLIFTITPLTATGTSSNPWLAVNSTHNGISSKTSRPTGGLSRNPHTSLPGREADPRYSSSASKTAAAAAKQTGEYRPPLDIPHTDITRLPPDGAPVETFDPVFGRDTLRVAQIGGIKSTHVSGSQGGVSKDTRTSIETTEEFLLYQKILDVSHPITGSGTGFGTDTTNLRCKGKCVATLTSHKSKWVLALAQAPPPSLSLAQPDKYIQKNTTNSSILVSAGEDGNVQVYAQALQNK